MTKLMTAEEKCELACLIEGCNAAPQADRRDLCEVARHIKRCCTRTQPSQETP